MSNILDIRSLDTYKNATEKQKKIIDKRKYYIYDFDKIKNQDIQKFLIEFVNVDFG